MPKSQPDLSNDMTPELPPIVATSFGFLLHKAAQKLREDFEAALAPHDLQARQAGLLMTLASAGMLSQQAIGQLHRVDRTTMVALIDDLEARELVERVRDPGDRRVYRLMLTRSGRAIAKKAAALLKSCEAASLAALATSEQDLLHGLLTKLVAIAATLNQEA
jgi:MarR family transcriptional regulator, lower aerobic nicotinate degradation pathway regulator